MGGARIKEVIKSTAKSPELRGRVVEAAGRITVSGLEEAGVIKYKKVHGRGRVSLIRSGLGVLAAVADIPVAASRFGYGAGKKVRAEARQVGYEIGSHVVSQAGNGQIANVAAIPTGMDPEIERRHVADHEESMRGIEAVDEGLRCFGETLKELRGSP